jgi:hypothetical protein
MRGERWLLRLGEFLVRRASWRLPSGVRDERYREWAAELPVILHDPDTRPGVLRAARMLGYALDTIRAATLGPHPARHRGAHRGGAGKSARWLLTGLALLVLLVLSVLFFAASIGILFDPAFAGAALAYWAAFWVLAALMLVSWVIARRRKRGSRVWLTAGMAARAGCLVLSSGQVALRAAERAGWTAGRLHTITLISLAAGLIGEICVVMAWAAGLWAVWHRSRRLRDTTPSSRDDPAS